MRIVKEGPGWQKEVTCTGVGNGGGGCGSTLQIDKFDLYHTYKSYMDGDRDTFNTFKCCLCGVETDIPDKEIPDSVKKIMPDSRKWSAESAEDQRRVQKIAAMTRKQQERDED